MCRMITGVYVFILLNACDRADTSVRIDTMTEPAADGDLLRTSAQDTSWNTDALDGLIDAHLEDMSRPGLVSDQGTMPRPPRCLVVPETALCDPNPPHQDRVGMVCFGDGTADESYCHIDAQGQWVCARSRDGGPCRNLEEMASGSGPATIDAGDFEVRDIDSDDPLSGIFARGVSTFGIRIVGTARVPAGALRHAAIVSAEYIDNDEDGEADDAQVTQSLQERRALLVMFADANELDATGALESRALDGFHIQDLYGDETKVAGRFDATLEEVLHLLQTAGYARVYPMALGENPGTRLTDAMDLARGGRFEDVPRQYPPEAWYHYDDQTCTYRCMAVEYFYWGLTSLSGGTIGTGEVC